MPSPKGEYTPKTGLFAGEQFRSYFAYQQARAQSLGFRNYSEQRRVTNDPMFRVLFDRARSVGGLSRNQATRTVRRLWRQNGGNRPRKHQAIAFGVEQHWWDDGDDARDDIPY